jgi:two-component system, OmpR family, phosphate regulon sensor histidine kinase PhoR
MKRQLIILVIIAITLSLIGLVGIQLYWIKNAVAVKEVNFERGVSEAVSRAIYKFNKIELARKALNQREQTQQMGSFLNMLDSLNRVYYNQIVSNQPSGALLEDYFPGQYFRQETNIQYFLQEDGQVIELIDPGRVDGTGSAAPEPGGYLRGTSQRTQQDPVSLFFERSRMINDLFDDLFSSRYSLHISSGESLNTLDSLLAAELQGHGINTSYEYGVFNPAFGTMLEEKSGSYTQELLQSSYVFSLFPNDIFLNPEYLLMYFPEQKKFILAQMNAMMAASTLLILVIISSFAYTIMTIFRQKKLSVMKNDFINNMTHELKTPIATISLACQALSDQDIQKSDVLYQRYIDMIGEENKRLGTMTEKVLQTALIDKGKLRLNVSGFDMHELITDSVNKISLQVEARNGEVVTKLQAGYSFVKADKVHLANVLFNLLDNANKYAPLNPLITISTANNAHGIVIHVQDNGVGISRQNQKKIFDTLYRVSTGNIHDVKGFGLGLSYVKAIVEQHGGWVSVISEPQKGSQFTVYLPFGFEEMHTKQNNLVKN